MGIGLDRTSAFGRGDAVTGRSNFGVSHTVLLVDDNPSDVDLVRQFLSAVPHPPRVLVGEDGVEALNILRRKGPYASAPRPDLIILDLNLPRIDGREVLAAIKNDRELREIPVVVLTTSSAGRDIAQCYQLNANCYVTKPLDVDAFEQTVQNIERFWLSTVKLPRAS